MKTNNNQSQALCYAQSGGVTAVINSSAAGCLLEAKRLGVPKFFGSLDGISGIYDNRFLACHSFTEKQINLIGSSPSAYFNSCRVKLPDWRTDDSLYRKIFANLQKKKISSLIYNGGNDSADTTHKLADYAKVHQLNINIVGLPKTIDNDLEHTDNCPGYASALKYLTVSVMEASLDVAAMHRSSTKAFIIEVMGRKAGWLACAGGLAAQALGWTANGPIMTLFPEIIFNQKEFLQVVQNKIKKHGFVIIVASEGIKNKQGYLSAQSSTDSFAHPQLGGVAPKLAQMLQTKLKLKCHWSVPDYLQRSARHLASKVDEQQAIALGSKAVKLAVAGATDVVPIIIRTSNSPYRWKIGVCPAKMIANHEKLLPQQYITKDGYFITKSAFTYLQPLIGGQASIKVDKHGLPCYRHNLLKL